MLVTGVTLKLGRLGGSATLNRQRVQTGFAEAHQNIASRAGRLSEVWNIRSYNIETDYTEAYKSGYRYQKHRLLSINH